MCCGGGLIDGVEFGVTRGWKLVFGFVGVDDDEVVVWWFLSRRIDLNIIRQRVV